MDGRKKNLYIHEEIKGYGNVKKCHDQLQWGVVPSSLLLLCTVYYILYYNNIYGKRKCYCLWQWPEESAIICRKLFHSIFVTWLLRLLRVKVNFPSAVAVMLCAVQYASLNVTPNGKLLSMLTIDTLIHIK